VHHSDRGRQSLSIRYTERLAEAGMEASVGSVGEEVEFATLHWVSWYNTQRLLEPIGYAPPVEYEEHYYRSQPTPAVVAGAN